MNSRGQAIIAFPIIFMILLALLAIITGGIAILGKFLIYALGGGFIGFILTSISGGITKKAKEFKITR